MKKKPKRYWPAHCGDHHPETRVGERFLANSEPGYPSAFEIREGRSAYDVDGALVPGLVPVFTTEPPRFSDEKPLREAAAEDSD